MHHKLGDNAFGDLLRFWRSCKKLSQEQLADKVESSTRQISRIEMGTSRPSESLVNNITIALGLLERDKNNLRIAAGFPTQSSHMHFHSSEMKWLRNAMMLSLKAQEPFPSMLLGETGDILMVNRSWVCFFRTTLSAERLNTVNNYWEFLFSEDGLGCYLEGWEDNIAVIYMGVYQGMILNRNPSIYRILKILRSHHCFPTDWVERASRLAPMASYRIRIPFNKELTNFYSVHQTVGALGLSSFVSAPHLTINTLYPENDGNTALQFKLDDVSHPLLRY